MQDYNFQQTYNDIKAHTHDLYDFDGEHCVIRPCLSITLFFKHGARAHVRQGLIKVQECFMDYFGEHIIGGLYGENKYARKNQKGLAKIKDFIMTSDPNEHYASSYFSSAKTIYDASLYSLYILTAGENTDDWTDPLSGQVYPAGHDNGALSAIKIILPIDFLNNPEQMAIFDSLLKQCFSQLPIWAGYAGISLSLPIDKERYLSQQYLICQNFTGIDIDTYWYFYSDDYIVLSTIGDEPNMQFYPYQYLKEENATIADMGYIKNITWLNIIPKVFLERLAEHQISLGEIKTQFDVNEYENCILIKACESPQLGSPKQGLPLSYVNLNKYLRYLRNPNNDAMQPNVNDMIGADVKNTKIWLERFDIENSINEVGITPLRPDVFELTKVLQENEVSTHSGYYQDPVTKKVIYLHKGDIAPSYPTPSHLSKSRSYVWYKLTDYGLSLIPQETLHQIKK